MFKTRRRWTIRLAALSLVATGSLVMLTPAAASAAACQTWLATDRKSVAWCTGAPGGYQAYAACNENSGNWFWTYGPWTYNNGNYYQSLSIAVCPEFSYIDVYGVIV